MLPGGVDLDDDDIYVTGPIFGPGALSRIDLDRGPMSPAGGGSLCGMTRRRPSPDSLRRPSTVGEGDDLITYDVRGDLSSGRRCSCSARRWRRATSGRSPTFTDRPVVTYDPRGTARNPTGTDEIPPEQHAEDLHRVIEALGVGPVDCMGTSGGAVNLLALAAAHPEDIHRAVAHEAAHRGVPPRQGGRRSRCCAT